jgi:hypothetical protein
VALFTSSQQLQLAQENLLRLGVSPAAIRGSERSTEPKFMLTLSIENAKHAEARDAMVTAGAAHISVRGQVEADWMSHNNGHVTGAGVTPGAGDSEAGVSGLTPREI